MPLYIKDDSVAALVATLAAERGVNKQEAVRLAVANELARQPQGLDWRERYNAWRAAHPLPAATGLQADKAFFGELSGKI